MSSAKDFFSEEEVKRIIARIAQAEKLTSGEICLHVEDACHKPVLKRAEEVFAKNKLHLTKQRNAILFYVAVKSRDFAVAGDKGIHEKVSQSFWDEINNLVIGYFKDGKYAEGLCRGIELCGVQLRNYFPIQTDDKNELSDEVTFS